MAYSNSFCDSKFTTLFSETPRKTRLKTKMTLLGDFAKGFLIVTVAAWIFLIINFSVMGQTAVALLLIIGFIPPLTMITYEYHQNRKKNKTTPTPH
jgi:hypothetical protein